MFAPVYRTAYHMLVAPCLDGRFTSCSVLATNLTLGVTETRGEVGAQHSCSDV